MSIVFFQLNSTCDNFEREKAKSFTHDELKTMFGSCNVWEKLFKILGFTFDTKKGGKMDFPEDDKARELIFSCAGLAAALHGNFMFKFLLGFGRNNIH